ncbi:MAG: hypothetical protein IJD98_02945 [Oscillospiraceae bacterium]|nr:hypothetical protein [Oscillospiraceae bacterium]
MNNSCKKRKLPAAAALLGCAAALLRVMLYGLAQEQRGLLVQGHPLTWALIVLSAAALAIIGFGAWKLDGSGEYCHNFGPNPRAFAGHLAAAAGIGITMLTRMPQMYGYLGQLWRLLGWLSPLCLVAAGFARKKGKQPFFLLHLIPCLFLAVHIVNHYQQWCADPQLHNYAFALFGQMALMFFAFYTAAFDANIGQRRMQLFMGLSAVYLLLAELVTTRYFWLLAGGIAWAITDLCSLTPVPKPEKPTDTQKES